MTGELKLDFNTYGGDVVLAFTMVRIDNLIGDTEINVVRFPCYVVPSS